MVMSIKPWITLTKMAKKDQEEINNQSLILNLTCTFFYPIKVDLVLVKNARNDSRLCDRGGSWKGDMSYFFMCPLKRIVWKGDSKWLFKPFSAYHTEDCWVVTSPFSKGRSLTGNVPLRLWLLHMIGWACTEGRETVPCPLWQTLGGFKKTTTGTGTSLNERFNEQNNGCARAL